MMDTVKQLLDVCTILTDAEAIEERITGGVRWLHETIEKLYCLIEVELRQTANHLPILSRRNFIEEWVKNRLILFYGREASYLLQKTIVYIVVIFFGNFPN